MIEWWKAKTIPEPTGGRSEEIIRTYHAPDNRVKDHESGHTESYKGVVEKGNLSGMIEARALEMRKKLLENSE